MHYCDAHLHIADIADNSLLLPDSCICASTHSLEDIGKTLAYIKKIPQPEKDARILLSFGVHPQNPDRTLLETEEALLAGQCRIDACDVQLAAVGECGFDLFSPEFAARIDEQESVWAEQIRLALAYNKPLVVHCRHAMDRLFRDASLLKKLPAVVFHSFSGSPIEARSFLRRGINAFFSFGKQILKGNKRAAACLHKESSGGIPVCRILAETDAPYQTLKNETETKPADIISVYEAMAKLRGDIDFSQFAAELEHNFKNAFGISFP
ncbi:MAG: TatD family hydrolase [Bacteroides sp.]|nr:TatD family hydrolase [Prevotella sp.]MCM1407777.1 TatD family hydrolase [Treponema brennaborense]MCM1468875.1 TatD family hydrolase [Bacteroides sp.]